MTGSSSSARRLLPLLRIPAVVCVLVAAALVAIGERYPFSPFPMYSNIDGRAEVLYITNENDEPMPSSKMFGTGSAQLKKRYESELEDVAGTKDYDRATDEQLHEAGRRFLDKLFESLRPHRVKQYGPKTLRVWILSLDSTEGEFREKRFSVAEKPVPPVP